MYPEAGQTELIYGLSTVSLVCVAFVFKVSSFLFYILSSKTHKSLTLITVCCPSQGFASTGSCCPYILATEEKLYSPKKFSAAYYAHINLKI